MSINKPGNWRKDFDWTDKEDQPVEIIKQLELKHPEFKILLSMENTGKKMKETMKEIN